MTVDGLPKPTFDFVGDDAGLVLPGGGDGAMVVYQDSTTQELLLATRQAAGMWSRQSIAGATNPWPGAYGSLRVRGIPYDGSRDVDVGDRPADR